MVDMSDMTKTEYARHRDVKQPYISKLIRQGKIPVKENGRINAADADFALDGNRERVPVRAEAEPSGGFDGGHGGRLTQAKVGTEIYRARLAQLEYELKVGKLVSVNDVRASMDICAEALARDLDRLPAFTDDLATAFTRGGIKDLRKALGKVAREMRAQMVENMRLIGEDAEDREAA